LFAYQLVERITTMVTIDSTLVCVLPVSRQAAGFPVRGDRGNALLLLAREMQPDTRAAYQQAGRIREGVCISSCNEQVFIALEQMGIRWCPWSERNITLAVLPHFQVSALADRLVVSRLLPEEPC
jgi:hypothetical protein